MNCELKQERIVTAVYGELPDAEAHELEMHLDDCAECRKAQQEVQALKVLAGMYPVAEPAANLVARSRIRLEEALDELPPWRWYERLAQRMRNGFSGLQAAPVAALLVLVAGAGAGTVGGYRLAENRAVHAAAVQQQASASLDQSPAQAEMATVANVSSVVRLPNSELVDVTYNQMVPRHAQGSLSDPGIRQLLMLATENAVAPGVRDNSVGLLAAECRAGRGCQATGVRDALMVALRYDKDPGVREKALEGLEPYVTQDVRVRNAVLEALLNDSDPQIRSASISMLEPVEADTSVRQVLYSVANTDVNPQIRNVSRQVLSRMPEIQ